MAKVQGHVDEKFASVKQLLQEQLDSANEIGASFTVNIDGKNVIDIWGGRMSADSQDPWEKDTIVNVWSSTKTIAALAVLVLVDQGKLDSYEKVSKYWPEFAQNGKENVEVRHFMSHTSGVPGWQDPITIKEVCDVAFSTNKLAEQAPWWEPGTASGYHSLDMGHLLGELVRRASGKSLKQFVKEDIASVIGADFQIGAIEEDWSRIATLSPPPPLAIDFTQLPKDSPMLKVFTNPSGMSAAVANTPEWRNAEIGAANGHSNARGLNRMASLITLGGTVDGKQLLSQKTIDLIFDEQIKNVDVVFAQPIRYGIGYGLRHEEGPSSWMPKGDKVCFWGGWGGSIVIMDLNNRITCTYAMNKMEAGTIGNERTKAYVKEVYRILGDDSVGVEAAPIL